MVCYAMTSDHVTGRDMTSPDLLQCRYPGLQSGLPRVGLANLPTPVREVQLTVGGRTSPIWIKEDDKTAAPVGGNKIRKLEYLFGDIIARRRRRVATYGTVASNHALATALIARRLNLEATCFLAHQTRTELARNALGWHARNGTEMVVFAGNRRERVAVQREFLWRRRAAVIPAGGSSWLGCTGFVNAGLELAAQVRDGFLPKPDRIYMAAGTMGSIAGLAVGLAIARLDVSIEAVRVSHSGICHEAILRRLCVKTCEILHRADQGFPADAWQRCKVRLRHEFFAPGYAKSSAETDAALALINAQTSLKLEATYTGKAMAALLADLDGCRQRGERLLFWNTYCALGAPGEFDRRRLPDPFKSYFDES